MWTFIQEHVLPLIATFLVGAAGWFITQFYAKPLLQFRELRQEIHEALFFHCNLLYGQGQKEELEQAKDELRRLAARLDAFRHSSSKLILRLLALLRYDLQKTVNRLTGVSNTLAMDKDTGRQLLWDVQKSLKLPHGEPERPTFKDR